MKKILALTAVTTAAGTFAYKLKGRRQQKLSAVRTFPGSQQ